MGRRRGFGQVFRRERRDGTQYAGYFIRWTSAAGLRAQEFGGATREAAETKLAARLQERAADRVVGVRDPRDTPSFVEALPKIVAACKARLKASTMRDRRLRLNALAPRLPVKPMRAVTTQDIDAIVTAMRADGLAASTVRHYIEVLSSAWQTAIRLGLAHVNPCRGVSLPRVEEKAVPWLSATDIDSLVAAMPPRMRGIVALIADTGLRGSEARALLWSDIAPDFSTVLVRESKSGRPRVVPLIGRAPAMLKELPRAGDRVFAIDRTTFMEDFRAAADRAGMPDITAHSLRHAYASGLVQAGVDLPTVARLLGHTTIQVTMRYAQWAPKDSAVRAVQALELARDGQREAFERTNAIKSSSTT
jgi:integrase